MNRKTTADGGQHSGGGKQGERLEGSLTDGGSLPGVANTDEDRSFGAGLRDEEEEGGDDPVATGRPSAA